MEQEKKNRYITANVNREDVLACIDNIIEDNKFDLKELLKECGINHLTKKLTLEHLVDICRHKGYKLSVDMPSDVLKLTYHLENQEPETTNPPVNDIPVDFQKDEDEVDELDFL